jgi:hypothetical protein
MTSCMCVYVTGAGVFGRDAFGGGEEDLFGVGPGTIFFLKGLFISLI